MYKQRGETEHKKLKIVDIVFAFNNLWVLKKLIARGKAIKHNNMKELEGINIEIDKYI